MFFETAEKVTKHLGYFGNKICHQEIPKIAQFGHTACNLCSSSHSAQQRRNVLLLIVVGRNGVGPLLIAHPSLSASSLFEWLVLSGERERETASVARRH